MAKAHYHLCHRRVGERGQWFSLSSFEDLQMAMVDILVAAREAVLETLGTLDQEAAAEVAVGMEDWARDCATMGEPPADAVECWTWTDNPLGDDEQWCITGRCTVRPCPLGMDGFRVTPEIRGRWRARLDAIRAAAGAEPTSPVPAGVQIELVELAKAYYSGVKDDSDGPRRLHNFGIAQAYDSSAENFELLQVGGLGRQDLAERMRRAAEAARADALAELNRDRKAQGFGMHAGYTAIAEALETEDPVAHLRAVLEGVLNTTAGKGIKGRWFRGR